MRRVHPIRERAQDALKDPVLMRTLPTATRRAVDKQRTRWAEVADIEALRARASELKAHTMAHLDTYLERFEEAAAEAGIRVHWAATKEEATATVLGILKEHDVRTVAKAKSMTTEELELLRHLRAAGIEAWETDLGEFIVQLSKRPPSHLTAPAIHEDTASISALFHEHLGTPETMDAEALSRAARDFLRDKMGSADAGVSGANLLVADTGRLVIVENEGNIRMCTTQPRLHVAVVGIEKLVPREEDVPVFLSLLARSATGQKLTTYTHWIDRPRRDDEREGPDEIHVVLLDGGRSRILADETTRATLHCIRCGSCLNVCPVYQAVGGHTYGGVYPGPIGAITLPQIRPDTDSRKLPYASSLCGACEEACPVKIPIPEILLRLRQDAVEEGGKGMPSWGRIGEEAAMRGWLHTVLHPKAFRRAGKIARALGRLKGKGERIRHLPPPLSGWTRHRDFPLPAKESFQDRWAARETREEEDAP